MAVSTGGGMFEIISLDEHPVRLKGDSYDLFIRCSPYFNPESLNPKPGIQSPKFRISQSEK